MKTTLKLATILVVAGLVAGAVVLKKSKKPAAPASTPSTPVAAAQPPAVSTAQQKLPKLVDLGAGKCIPCKKMAPILEELKKEYAGKMEVEFVDVWQDPDAGNKYGIRLIPTQIFYDATGKEMFRHEGFFGREDILGKWKELGVGL
jgi:thioredoxin 1